MKCLSALFATLLLAASSSVAAADVAAGAAKVKEVCQACHGMDGNSQVPDNPKLGGQRPDYIAKALRDYKSGARKNPIMGGQVSGLSAQDMADLAAYFASQKGALHVVR
jgi:cytochrome c553